MSEIVPNLFLSLNFGKSEPFGLRLGVLNLISTELEKDAYRIVQKKNDKLSFICSQNTVVLIFSFCSILYIFVNRKLGWFV